MNYLLLRALLLLFSAQLCAITATGKTTYVLPRALNHGAFVLPYPSQLEQASALTVAPFYFKTTNKKQFGYYFGTYDAPSDTLRNYFGVGADEDDLLYPQQVIWNSNGSDPNDAGANPLRQKIVFKPDIEEYGVLISSTTRLNEYTSITLSSPYVERTHRLNYISDGAIRKQTVEGKEITLLQFLQGGVEQHANPNQQDKLRYAKVEQKQRRSGTGDITVSADLTPLSDKTHHVTLGLHCVLATSAGSSGEFLFEPLLGSAGHTLCGGHAQLFINAYEFASGFGCSLRLGASHTLGFSAQEVRTIGFSINGNISEQGHYLVVGKKGTNILFPLANISTQPVLVKPASTTQVIAHCGLYTPYVSVTAGYQFTHAGEEKVELQNNWPEPIYAISNFTYETGTQDEGENDASTPFDVTEDYVYRSLAASDLAPSVAQTASHTIHSISIDVITKSVTSWNIAAFASAQLHVTPKNNFGIEGYSLRGGIQLCF